MRRKPAEAKADAALTKRIAAARTALATAVGAASRRAAMARLLDLLTRRAVARDGQSKIKG
ncbi:hypothetical protein [Jannaschia aquimarina]|uniref:Uncharacterized protein n=1 Tax=Jannaschia aquimarina TaxID=935700 RepID=A0A0D1ELL0_9RHOB|nr:hypothetical protein [Jannaschia aquimarina]KIT16660.1 hypothetical protein jaqu_16270 [Jannaschia aquimarina]SNS93061.1 hypothetical protein SAMN05421775_103354 [Jannaschia aquimarina]